MIKHVLFFGLMLGVINALAQNFIPNNGFEQGNNIPCPKEIKELAGNWVCFQRATWIEKGSNNYVNTCFNKIYSKPENAPKKGTGYLTYTVNPTQKTKNLFHVKLSETLKAGTLYYAEFYVRIKVLGKTPDKPISEKLAGLCFTEKDIKPVEAEGLAATTDTKTYDFEPQIKIQKLQKAEKYYEWRLISGTFTAKGNEKYLVLGNFAKIAFNAIISIDEVSLMVYNESCVNLDNARDLKVGARIILNDINFEANKDVLLPGSGNEISKLKTFLESNPNLRVDIRGHVNDPGFDDYLVKLSEARAYTIMFDLAGRGIAMDRLTSKGYGNQQPITTIGSPKNTRIEIVVTGTDATK